MIFQSQVIESRPLTPTTHMIRVEKPSTFEFEPVQFCGLEIPTSEGSEEYPMSLASSPTREYLEFGARMSSSPWKRGFAGLRPGDQVEVDGPYGHFVLDERRDAVFVAGGIGVTPLKGMAEYLADTHSKRRALMLYSNRSEDEIVYRADLETLEGINARFRVIHTLTREPENSGWTGRRGRVDSSLLEEAAKDLHHPTFYLCGKADMVTETGQTLLDLGVPAERIEFEIFRGYR